MTVFCLVTSNKSCLVYGLLKTANDTFQKHATCTNIIRAVYIIVLQTPAAVINLSWDTTSPSIPYLTEELLARVQNL